MQQAGLSGSPSHNVVDLEGDADPQQKGQGDDVCEIERKAVENADLERHCPGKQQRNERQQHVDYPPQGDEKQNGNRDKGENAGLDECPGDGSSHS